MLKPNSKALVIASRLLDKLEPSNLSIIELLIMSVSIKVNLSRIEYMLLSIEENSVLNMVLIVFIMVSVMFDWVFMSLPPFIFLCFYSRSQGVIYLYLFRCPILECVFECV